MYSELAFLSKNLLPSSIFYKLIVVGKVGPFFRGLAYDLSDTLFCMN